MSILNEKFNPGKVQRTYVAGVQIPSDTQDLVYIRQLGPDDVITFNYHERKVLSQPYMVVDYGGTWKKIDNSTPSEERDGAIWQVDLDP